MGQSFTFKKILAKPHQRQHVFSSEFLSPRVTCARFFRRAHSSAGKVAERTSSTPQEDLCASTHTPQPATPHAVLRFCFVSFAADACVGSRSASPPRCSCLRACKSARHSAQADARSRRPNRSRRTPQRPPRQRRMQTRWLTTRKRRRRDRWLTSNRDLAQKRIARKSTPNPQPTAKT